MDKNILGAFRLYVTNAVLGGFLAESVATTDRVAEYSIYVEGVDIIKVIILIVVVSQMLMQLKMIKIVAHHS